MSFNKDDYSQYYRNQLDKVLADPDYPPTFKVWGNGETHHLTLNAESLAAFNEWATNYLKECEK